jgi:two-component system LytT family response regulator
MVKLKTIVVDDELLARKLILSCLEELPEIEILAECANGREAVRAVLELEPDLMFLDIMMPGLNGFEVIKKIQPEVLPMVIFCTAYERYALAAFDIHAVDSIETIASTVTERLPLREKTRITSLPVDQERKITIKDRDSIKLVKVDSIAWVDAAGDYMCVHAEGETHIMRCTMKHLLDELDDTVFKRVHRSTIVNLNCIEEVIPHTKGEYFLQLDNGERIKVSRNYRGEIKMFLNSINER